jgi:DNA-binding NarL/FixJ family response regulator
MLVIYSRDTDIGNRLKRALSNYSVKLYSDIEKAGRFMRSSDVTVYVLDDAELDAPKILTALKQHTSVFFLRSKPDANEGGIVLKYGAKGYGNANMSTPVLRQAIDLISSGNIWVYPELMAEMISYIPAQKPKQDISGLTPRESEIALLVRDGLTNPQIAEQLGVAEITIKKTLSSVYAKLNLKDRLTLAMFLKDI